ncbi:MAG: hypothetical protein WCV69_04780 [Patescibacteria group bacterium]|jgi:hypothetical protein
MKKLWVAYALYVLMVVVVTVITFDTVSEKILIPRGERINLMVIGFTYGLFYGWRKRKLFDGIGFGLIYCVAISIVLHPKSTIFYGLVMIQPFYISYLPLYLIWRYKQPKKPHKGVVLVSWRLPDDDEF